jgi:D-amino-acid oxidase
MARSPARPGLDGTEYLFGVSTPRLDVFVIGAGVSGLTSAICLAEAGLSVAIQAAEPPRATTSVVAGALWGTHLVGEDERVPGWADLGYAVLTELAANPATGAHVSQGVMAVRVEQDEPPEAPSAAVPVEYTPCDELPPGYVAGWRLTAPLVSMPDYLSYLETRFLTAGGRLLEARKFASLADAMEHSDARVIVNCPGAGARDLVPDPSVTAVRGQVVVAANPGLTEFFVGNGADPDDLTYVFPHGDTVILGGTQEHGRWSRDPDPATAEQILAACAAVDPRLRGVRVLEHRVGLRPARPRVRLEAETVADGRGLVHNYGHGGAGISLSWGCAQDAAKLAIAALG